MSDQVQRGWHFYLVDMIEFAGKTNSVATDDGHQWNIAPGLLYLVQSVVEPRWP